MIKWAFKTAFMFILITFAAYGLVAALQKGKMQYNKYSKSFDSFSAELKAEVNDLKNLKLAIK